MTTKQIDDGGPAFPNVWEDNPSQGMSLRDFHAAHVIGGLHGNRGISFNTDIQDMARMVRWAYAVADAMIAGRGG